MVAVSDRFGHPAALHWTIFAAGAVWCLRIGVSAGKTASRPAGNGGIRFPGQRRSRCRWLRSPPSPAGCRSSGRRPPGPAPRNAPPSAPVSGFRRRPARSATPPTCSPARPARRGRGRLRPARPGRGRVAGALRLAPSAGRGRPGRSGPVRPPPGAGGLVGRRPRPRPLLERLFPEGVTEDDCPDPALPALHHLRTGGAALAPGRRVPEERARPGHRGTPDHRDARPASGIRPVSAVEAAAGRSMEIQLLRAGRRRRRSLACSTPGRVVPRRAGRRGAVLLRPPRLRRAVARRREHRRRPGRRQTPGTAGGSGVLRFARAAGGGDRRRGGRARPGGGPPLPSGGHPRPGSEFGPDLVTPAGARRPLRHRRRPVQRHPRGLRSPLSGVRGAAAAAARVGGDAAGLAPHRGRGLPLRPGPRDLDSGAPTAVRFPGRPLPGHPRRGRRRPLPPRRRPRRLRRPRGQPPARTGLGTRDRPRGDRGLDGPAPHRERRRPRGGAAVAPRAARHRRRPRRPRAVRPPDSPGPAAAAVLPLFGAWLAVSTSRGRLALRGLRARSSPTSPATPSPWPSSCSPSPRCCSTRPSISRKKAPGGVTPKRRSRGSRRATRSSVCYAASEAARQLDEELPRLESVGPDTAYRLWLTTGLARSPAASALEARGPEGVVSRFRVGFDRRPAPPDSSPAPPEWTGLDGCANPPAALRGAGPERRPSPPAAAIPPDTHSPSPPPRVGRDGVPPAPGGNFGPLPTSRRRRARSVLRRFGPARPAAPRRGLPGSAGPELGCGQRRRRSLRDLLAQDRRRRARRARAGWLFLAALLAWAGPGPGSPADPADRRETVRRRSLRASPERPGRPPPARCASLRVPGMRVSGPCARPSGPSRGFRRPAAPPRSDARAAGTSTQRSRSALLRR